MYNNQPLWVGMLLAVAMTTTALAHPVIWKGGHVSILKTTTKQTEVIQHYSLTPKWALGARWISFDSNRLSYLVGGSNHLLKRWNETDSQANIYASTGVGVSRDSAPSLHLNLQADWENRRYYTLIKGEYHAIKTPQTNLRARAGIAPYIAEFNGIHTWLIAQLDDTITSSRHELTITPVIRVFKHNVLVEIGSNFNTNTMITLMVHL